MCIYIYFCLYICIHICPLVSRQMSSQILVSIDSMLFLAAYLFVKAGNVELKSI